MTIHIRDAVFETNSSSSHSVTVSTEELADSRGISKATLRGGVIHAHTRAYGWEWERFYSPGAKIAYLVTQLAGGYASGNPGKDVTLQVRRDVRVDSMLSMIERRTGCRVEVIGTRDASIDHDSVGTGVELFSDDDQLMRFIFGARSYVETGNDNSPPPMTIETDIGAESYHENRFVPSAGDGERFQMTLDLYGANVFMHPESGDPIYAYVDSQEDLNAFVADLDGLVIDKVAVWSQRPESLSEENAAEDAHEFVHEYLTDLIDLLPGMKIVRDVRVEPTFDVSAKDLDAWDRQSSAHFTLYASAEPEKVARMAALLSRHSGMAPSHP